MIQINYNFTDATTILFINIIRQINSIHIVYTLFSICLNRVSLELPFPDCFILNCYENTYQFINNIYAMEFKYEMN